MVFHLKYICPYQDRALNANSPSSLEAESGGQQLLQGKPGLHTEQISKTNKWKQPEMPLDGDRLFIALPTSFRT